jgi:spore germination protein YaaH
MKRLSMIVFVLSTLVAGFIPGAAHATTEQRKVVGYVAYWDQARAVETIRANPGTFTELSPSWLSLNGAGGLVWQSSDPSGLPDPALLDVARKQGIKLVPTIANYRNHVWDNQVVSRVLRDPALRKRHVERIVGVVTGQGWAGIDIDYEHLRAQDRDYFSAFMAELGVALHAHGKTLATAVHPKTSDPGWQPKNQAQNYAALGRADDEVRVMLYDYTWDLSAPGAHAPIAWVKEVVAWTVTQVPPRKVILGAPLYGYDWPSSGPGETLMWKELMARRTGANALLRWDPTTASAWFTYNQDGFHTVWFENASSTAAKLEVMNTYGIGGIHFWRLGGEDPATWPVVRAATATAP